MQREQVGQELLAAPGGGHRAGRVPGQQPGLDAARHRLLHLVRVPVAVDGGEVGRGEAPPGGQRGYSTRAVVSRAISVIWAKLRSRSWALRLSPVRMTSLTVRMVAARAPNWAAIV